MSFTSLSYLTLLIFVVIIYYVLPHKFRIFLIIAASYYFYCSWKPIYGVLILFSSLLDYFASIKIDKSNSKRKKKFFLMLSIFGNLGLLFYFKYTNFAVDVFNSLLGILGRKPFNFSLHVILPIGISFYTFQTLGYTIDVYRGKIKPCRNIWTMLGFVSFFPQLVAGPIEKASDLMPQLEAKHELSFKNINNGIMSILWGVFKKVVISDRLYMLAYPMIELKGQLPPTKLLIFALFLAIVIYADFSAYTDIAIGSARLLGINLSENFNFPYLKTNISDFWNSWHMTLTRWVKEYVFFPMGGISRNLTKTAFNLVFVMFLVGLWHGASYNFVLWGVFQGVCLLIYFLWKVKFKRKMTRYRIFKKSCFFGKVISYILTQGIWISIGVFFFARDLHSVKNFWKNIFWGKWENFNSPLFKYGLLLVFLAYFMHYVHKKALEKKLFQKIPFYLKPLIMFFLTYIIIIFSISPTQFIYYQF